MVALDIRVTADEGWDQWQWWRLPPSALHAGDVVDLDEEVAHYTNSGLMPVRGDRLRSTTRGQNHTTSMWKVTHVTLDRPGLYRLGLLPLKGWGGQIDLHFHSTTRLRVKR